MPEVRDTTTRKSISGTSNLRIGKDAPSAPKRLSYVRPASTDRPEGPGVMAACLTTLLGALFNNRIARFLKNVNRLGRKNFRASRRGWIGWARMIPRLPAVRSWGKPGVLGIPTRRRLRRRGSRSGSSPPGSSTLSERISLRRAACFCTRLSK